MCARRIVIRVAVAIATRTAWALGDEMERVSAGVGAAMGANWETFVVKIGEVGGMGEDSFSFHFTDNQSMDIGTIFCRSKVWTKVRNKFRWNVCGWSITFQAHPFNLNIIVVFFARQRNYLSKQLWHRDVTRLFPLVPQIKEFMWSLNKFSK